MERHDLAKEWPKQNALLKVVSFASRQKLKKNVIVETISVLLIILFVYAAFNKLYDFQKFKAELGKSPLLTNYAGLIAIVMPALEILISVLLSMSRFRLIALYMSFGLMTSFTAYIIAILQYSYYIPCSCGGVLESLGWNEHIIFNAFFVIISAIGVFLIPGKRAKYSNSES